MTCNEVHDPGGGARPYDPEYLAELDAAQRRRAEMEAELRRLVAVNDAVRRIAAGPAIERT